LILTASLLFTRAAFGQQAVHTPSAAQPSTGVTLFQQMFQWRHLHDDPLPENRKITEEVFMTMLQYGLTNDLALMLEVPTIIRQEHHGATGTDQDFAGLGDVHVMGKLRVYRHDAGPIDTTRVIALGGVELPSGTGPFGSNSFDPMFGAAFTQIDGRHGLNAAVRWTFVTGDNSHPVDAGENGDDLLLYDLAYVHRWSPDVYSANTRGATYLILELNGLYETNGDNEVFLAPGFMYESRRWAFETSVQLPAWQALDHRPEATLIFTVGIPIFVLGGASQMTHGLGSSPDRVTRLCLRKTRHGRRTRLNQHLDKTSRHGLRILRGAHHAAHRHSANACLDQLR
jgi:hypothetical protein